MKGYIRQRGASWELFVELGRDATGRRQRRTTSVQGTKREAEAKLRRMLTEVDSGMHADPGKVNVATFLREWLEYKVDLQPGTKEKYEQIVEHHLIPSFGSLSLLQLRPDTIRAAYAGWLLKGRRIGDGGLSAATIRKFHTVLRQALQIAVDDGLVMRNAAAGLRLPRGESRKKRALTDEEIEVLVNDIADGTLGIPVLVLLATGLRRGELLALTWPDVDFEAGTLAVRRSVEKTSAGLRLKSPKTNRARVVAVPSVALEALRLHRAEQEEARRRYGEAWSEQGLVFPGLLGSLWDPAVFSRAFRRAAVRVGVGSIGPHTLRHTAATEMLRQGIHPKVVADRLGHSTTRMTLDVYSHVIPALESEAATKVDAAIRSKFGQHWSAFSGSARTAEANKKATKVRGIKVSDGGRERSRTSDLYSVNVALYP